VTTPRTAPRLARPASPGDSQSDMLRSVSRTFAVSIELLPRPLRDAMTVGYLLFRVADCLEDNPDMPPERKSALLRLWASVLRGEADVDDLTAAIADLDADDPEVRVARSAGEILERLGRLAPEVGRLLVWRVSKTADGMARWQDHGPWVGDEADLDDYMHEVAGRVGYLVTDLYAWYAPSIRPMHERLLPLGRQAGLALQTVNVIRGLRSDYSRGWVFVPRSYLSAVGLAPEDLLNPASSDRALEVVRLLCDKAAEHLAWGLEYVTALPRRNHRIRLASMLPLFLAVATLSVSRDNPQVLLGEAKVSRSEVISILRHSAVLGWSNKWVRHYYSELGGSAVLGAPVGAASA
jgi:farnesyl-diphosphate farnesyltransferase